MAAGSVVIWLLLLVCTDIVFCSSVTHSSDIFNVSSDVTEPKLPYTYVGTRFHEYHVGDTSKYSMGKRGKGVTRPATNASLTSWTLQSVVSSAVGSVNNRSDDLHQGLDNDEEMSTVTSQNSNDFDDFDLKPFKHVNMSADDCSQRNESLTFFHRQGSVFLYNTQNTVIPYECWFVITVPWFLSLKVQLEVSGLECVVSTLYSRYGIHIIQYERMYGIAPGKRTFVSEGSVNISVRRQLTPSRPFYLNLTFYTFELVETFRFLRVHYNHFKNGKSGNIKTCCREKVKL